MTEEVPEGELKDVLQSFQKDKSFGSNGWTIEFFLELFETLGGDLLKVVEETWVTGSIPASFNFTCIELIPKVDNPVTLNDFRPISLCNYVYKVVTKVIAKRLKGIFSEHITKEQFGFLEGRQIHDAIRVA